MIVISNSLVLTEEEEENENLPWIAYENIVTSTNISTDSAHSNYPAVHLANPNTNLFWRSENGNEQFITITVGARDIDYIAIARHNLGSEGISITIEGDTGDSPSWEALVQETLLGNDEPAIFRFNPTVLDGVRLRLIPQSPTAIPQVSVVYAGTLLVMQQGVQADYVPIPYARIAEDVNGRSERGNFLGRIRTGSYLESTASFANLTPAWFRTYCEPFLESAADLPFFFAWLPDTYPDEVGYCWLNNSPQASHDLDGYVALDLQMGGIDV